MKGWSESEWQGAIIEWMRTEKQTDEKCKCVPYNRWNSVPLEWLTFRFQGPLYAPKPATAELTISIINIRLFTSSVT